MGISAKGFRPLFSLMRSKLRGALRGDKDLPFTCEFRSHPFSGISTTKDDGEPNWTALRSLLSCALCFPLELISDDLSTLVSYPVWQITSRRHREASVHNSSRLPSGWAVLRLRLPKCPPTSQLTVPDPPLAKSPVSTLSPTKSWLNVVRAREALMTTVNI